MNEDAAKKRLGRGLAALIGEMDRPDTVEQAPGDNQLAIEAISANPNNPRRNFTEQDLADLSQSIREHGVVQPVVVRPISGSDRYELIAGERRWKAAKRAGLREVPAIVRDVDDKTALELAIIENVQRADLNPVEEARGYQQLVDEHTYTQADLAQVIGKSRSHVANTLRLLALPQPVLDMLTDGSITAGHARTLITVDDPVSLAKRIVDQGLSVRQVEALAQNSGQSDGRSRQKGNGKPGKDADTKALEKAISDAIGYTVTISDRGNRGDVKIAYKSLEQLDDICHRLGAKIR
ncbi:MAG: ParB/RepB/Spo0J family partition protein [Rhizobiaceae bacterium]